MNRVTAYEAIRARFYNMWPTKVGGTLTAPTVPYSFDNDRKPSASTFAIVEITTVDDDQETLGPIGARKFEHTGWIDVNLYGPKDVGRTPLDILAGYVQDIFDSVRIGNVGVEEGITTFATSPQELRKAPEAPQLWMLVARTPFGYIEIR